MNWERLEMSAKDLIFKNLKLFFVVAKMELPCDFKNGVKESEELQMVIEV